MKLSEAVKILADAKVPSPRHDARELFMKVGGMSLTELISGDASCDLPELQAAIDRRKNREPLQYIIGSVDFYRESYEVCPDCLIPRQDTEILVDFAVNNIPSGKKFLDLCTGSGCVAISTLKNSENTTAVAVDISEGAISVAKRNAKKNGVSDRVEFLIGDVFNPPCKEKYFAILSNPPYVREEVYAELEPEIYFEPKIAFTAGDFGLEFYKKIITLYKKMLDPCGFFAFEIGYDQGESLKEIAKSNGMSCEIVKDYSDNDRVAVIRPL